jgi:hypothetical protein
MRLTAHSHVPSSPLDSRHFESHNVTIGLKAHLVGVEAHIPDMLSKDPFITREAQFAKILNSEEDVKALRAHVKEIIESPAFNASHRCCKCLAHLVDQAIAGRFDNLKERVIGTDLFGRSPSYDTGGDAIVRVTVNDLRKRLLQYYDQFGGSSKFRIRIPAGSYIPEITYENHLAGSGLMSASKNGASVPIHSESAHAGSALEVTQELPKYSPAGRLPDTGEKTNAGAFKWVLLFCVLVVALNLALWAIFWMRSTHQEAHKVTSPLWSVLLSSAHATHLITSDPNILYIQGVTHTRLSVSDYANHNYIPEHNNLTPEQLHFCQTMLGSDAGDAVDVPIVLRVGQLAVSVQGNLDVRAARSMRIADLRSDDNFILLGSPLSNPWFSLFDDQLDFRFDLDKDSIANLRPRPHELPVYTPTATSGLTGQTFAIIALVQNIDRSGQTLLLAGLDAEGTDAAGSFITNLPRLSDTLQKCGIKPSGPLQHFELLLRLNTMAGTPSDIDVVACHILPGIPSHRS